jgi:hypothetical protein
MIYSSMVIKELFAGSKLFKHEGRAPPAVAFFYFDCRTKDTQNVEMALRRMILQLSAQSPHPYRLLDDWYELLNGQVLPSYQDLHLIFQQIIRELSRTYIILDALDECDDGDFNRLVDLVLSLRQWTESPLHLLITSQTRRSFTDAFRGIARVIFQLKDTQKDIRFFIASEIKTKANLELWRPHAKQVVDRITHKSKGMSVISSLLNHQELSPI